MSIWGYLVDQILISLNYHSKNCMVGTKENYKFDVGGKGLIPQTSHTSS